jgi:type II secretory pathway component PulL
MSGSSPILFADELPAARAIEALRARGDARGPVVLALPSRACLAATIDAAGLGRKDRRAGIFRLEDKLPVAAEDVTADLVRAGTSALGVCTATTRLKPDLDALELAGIQIQSIVPAALLVSQALVPDDGAYVILIGDGDAVDVVAVEAGVPIAWAWSGASIDDIQLQIDLLSDHFRATPRLLAVQLKDVLYDSLRDGTGRHLATRIDAKADELAAKTARRITDGRIAPWIELRRDALAPTDRRRTYRRALNFALASAAMLLLAMTISAIVRSARYDRAAQSAQGEMAAEFQRGFPGWAMPANVRAIVESERQKQLESGGPAPDASALASMRGVLAAVPANARFVLDSMSFDAAAFELSGRAHDLSDVQALAAAARATGFDVPPALTRREADGTWSVTLSGTRVAGTRSSAAIARGGGTP